MSLTLAASSLFFFFFFNDTATTEIYTLSLHDALPISESERLSLIALVPYGEEYLGFLRQGFAGHWTDFYPRPHKASGARSEEHTSELQSLTNLVCRLLLEKKKNINTLIKICMPNDTME